MITLRALEPEDIELLYTAENDMTIWNCGNTNVPYSHDILRQYILSTTGDIYTDKQLRLVICLDGKPIGLTDLTDFDPRNQRAEVGIMILPEYQNNGYGKETLARLVDYATKTIHLHQLYAVIPADNEASLSIFRNNGFNNEKSLADWIFDGREYMNAILLQRIL